MVTLIKAGAGWIRGADGLAYVFARSDRDQAALRPGDHVAFQPDGPRFGRWRAKDLMRIDSTSSTINQQGASA